MNNNTCLFNVYGYNYNLSERATGAVIARKYGRDFFNSEAVEHSEWCHCRNDRYDTEPPF